MTRQGPDDVTPPHADRGRLRHAGLVMSSRRPGRRTGVRAWLLAFWTLVGLLVLGAGTASAASLPDGQTRVQVSTSETITAVGMSEHIAAGQGRGPPVLQGQFVVATGVAAETGGETFYRTMSDAHFHRANSTRTSPPSRTR